MEYGWLTRTPILNISSLGTGDDGTSFDYCITMTAVLSGEILREAFLVVSADFRYRRLLERQTMHGIVGWGSGSIFTVCSGIIGRSLYAALLWDVYIVSITGV